MPRARDPNRDKAYSIYKKHNGSIDLVEIASQLSVSPGTVRGWKSKDDWEHKLNGTLQTNTERSKRKKDIKELLDDGTRETMQNEDLTHEQRLFCIYYSKIFNAAQSYQKAYKCTYESALTAGPRLFGNVEVKKEVQRLCKIKAEQASISENDLLELHMRIAFADIGSYISFGRKKFEGPKGTYIDNYVDLKKSEDVDTQLIQEVKEGREGISIKLVDKHKSMDWLDKFFLMNPMDRHKIEYDKLKLQLEQKKIEPEEKGTGNEYKGIPASMIAPSFINVVHDIEEQMHNEYVFPGGRMSTKSSFISLEIIDLIEKNPEMHAAVYRQVADTLRDSVYAQICWAIQSLGLEDEYKCNISPMEITKKSTGQKIFFRGCDDPYKSKGIKAPTIDQKKAKSIKAQQLKRYADIHGMEPEELEHLTSEIQVSMGYIGILWFEELDQFKGQEAIRTVTQSVIRGGEKTYIFKSFNPPKSASNWANKYIKIPKDNMLVTFSTYLDVPKSWLGKPALDEAEYLKEVNPTAYENEYLGIANGTGGNVFDNVTIKAITDEEIAQFDKIYNGVDWGWYPDLYAFVRVHYEPAQAVLYIWKEYTCNKQRNRQTADKIIELGITSYDLITCDSAEKKSVGDYTTYGLLARAADKGPGSREYSYKWLQSLKSIIIDNVRCPVGADEFLNYEYERDKEGNVISGYPDGNDHVIDAVRYAMNSVWKKRGQ